MVPSRSKKDSRKRTHVHDRNVRRCTKRKISHAKSLSISVPPSSPAHHPRPSPTSPLPSPFPDLGNQIPATPTTSPPVPTSPAPVPPAVKISPETKTANCNNADVSLAYPASETGSMSLDPIPDLDPPTEEVTAKKLRRLEEQLVDLNKELERFAENLKGKIETNVLGGAVTENNNNTASKLHEKLTISSGEAVKISFACPCGRSVTIRSQRENLEVSCTCGCGRSHNVVHMISQ